MVVSSKQWVYIYSMYPLHGRVFMKKNRIVVSKQDVREANGDFIVRSSNGQFLLSRVTQVTNAPYKVQRIVSDAKFTTSDITQAGNIVLKSFARKAA